ncbi:Uncharacterised protein [uncultured archaeon]|nr:Uncharacterised protein [uncultured archaeon]
MSLIIAVAGSKEAIIAGDKRSITFLGSCPQLEQELYGGMLKTDEDLLNRARELGASLQVSDGREKVWRRGDVLVGEVTEISPVLERRRRIYLVPGAYIMADVTGKEAKVIGKGKVACMVFGNRFTQDRANQGIKNAKCKIDAGALEAILANISSITPSISPEHCVLSTEVRQPKPEAAVLDALQEDCQKCGWRLCGQQ